MWHLSQVPEEEQIERNPRKNKVLSQAFGGKEYKSEPFSTKFQFSVRNSILKDSFKTKTPIPRALSLRYWIKGSTDIYVKKLLF